MAYVKPKEHKQFELESVDEEQLPFAPIPAGATVKEGELSSPNYSSGKVGWKVDSDGTGEFSNLFITGVQKTVGLSQDIQDAIEIVGASGGGEIRLEAGTYTLEANLTIDSGVSLVGAGRDNTILEFSGAAYGIVMKGTAAAIKKNILLKDFTLQNSNNAAGIDIDFADNWRMENVRVTSCDQKGIRINSSQGFLCDNIRSDNNTGNNWEFEGSATRTTSQFVLINCEADNGSAIGFAFIRDTIGAGLNDFELIRCTSVANTGDGFDFYNDVAGGFVVESTFLSCVADRNANGFDFDSNLQEILFIGCRGRDNSGVSMEFDGRRSAFIGCGLADMDINNDENTVVGSIVSISSALGGASAVANLNGSTVTESEVYTMINTSGGTLTAGDVVVLKAVADGDEIDTTTTQGDDYVLGMVSESITNTLSGTVITRGFTSALKVNGEEDISIGSFLQTYTVTGIAALASTAAQTVFAIALEAYTTGDDSGVVDALIIPPRTI